MCDKAIDKKFWKKTNKSSSFLHCWEWQGAIDRYGYGRVLRPKIKDKPLKAHHYAFYLHNGRWPEGACVHACGSRSCVNPYHLCDSISPPDEGRKSDYLDVLVRREYVKGSRVNGLSALARKYDLPRKVLMRLTADKS